MIIIKNRPLTRRAAVPTREITMLNTVTVQVLTAVAAMVGVLAAGPNLAMAQEVAFPTKPVRITVTYPPGGTVDAVARIVATKLAQRWGQPVLVNNQAGGGLIGAEAVVKAPADGYTLMVDASNHAQKPGVAQVHAL